VRASQSKSFENRAQSNETKLIKINEHHSRDKERRIFIYQLKTRFFSLGSVPSFFL
jgi:hypothetical protein